MITRFGAFTFDRQRRRLARDGQDVHLTPKAFDLLLVLLDAAPRVLPKNELHARLWPGTFVADATLASVVKELRRALDDRDSARPIIRTVNRVGFAFACPVDQVGSAQIARAHWLVGRDKRFPLQAGENMIGRDPASAVWLDVASVSRRHARIAITDSAATLEDLQSKNGTKVGDVMVTTPIALQDGDPIRIGTVPLTYRTSAEGLSTETHASAMHVDTPAAVPHESADSGRPRTAKR